MLIKNGLVFTEENIFLPLTIQTNGELITSLTASHSSTESPAPEETVIDASGCYVIPGLTDIHFHGCNGYDFCDNNLEAYKSISEFCLSNGVTSICPATMTLPVSELKSICETAVSFYQVQQQKSPVTQADFLGIHMEGPFISIAKKGAQNNTYIENPNSFLIRHLLDASHGLIKLISLAPELPNSLTCIQEFKNEVSFSVAHTEADYETAKTAMDMGALHVTHLFNAMPSFHHRDTGVIGAAADTEDCYVELICDGIHVSAPAVRAAFKLFEDRIILISDSMRATGKPDGTYTLGGQSVTVNGRYATVADGTLAGSVTPLFECLKIAVSMGIPLEKAIVSSTLNPCRSIGMDHLYGSIRPGKKAHLLLIDKHSLEIKRIIKGQPV